MDKLVVYLEVDGLGEDGHGNPCPASIKADFNANVEKMPSLTELTANTKLKDYLLVTSLLDDKFTADDCCFISAEEYEAEYGNDDDDGDEEDY